jgi:CBS domain-containing protein
MLSNANCDGARADTSDDQLACVDRELSVLELSRVMRKLGTTRLLVTSGRGDTRRAVGVVTARDIVTRIVAVELDPAVLTAGDIAWASPPGVSTTESHALHQQGARS